MYVLCDECYLYKQILLFRHKYIFVGPTLMTKWSRALALTGWRCEKVASDLRLGGRGHRGVLWFPHPLTTGPTWLSLNMAEYVKIIEIPNLKLLL